MSVAADGTGKLSTCVAHVVGVATWDAAASDLLTQRKVKTSKSKPEVQRESWVSFYSSVALQNFIAAVWSSPDRPVVATKDGVLRIYDVWLQICVSPLATSVFTRPVQASYMASVSVQCLGNRLTLIKMLRLQNMSKICCGISHIGKARDHMSVVLFS